MSAPDETPTTGIDDEALPEDLIPSDDNPLAKGLSDGETVDDLMESGKPVEDSAKEPGESDPSGQGSVTD